MDVWALVLVYNPCLVGFGVFVFRVAQCCSECVCAFEMYLDPSSLAYLLEFVSCVGDVGDNYGGLVVVIAPWFVGVGVVGGFGLAGMVEFVFPIIECPGRELAVVEGCFDV